MVRAPGKGIQRRVFQRDSHGYREHLPEQYQGHSPVQEAGNGTVAVGIIEHRFSTSAKRRADWRGTICWSSRLGSASTSQRRRYQAEPDGNPSSSQGSYDVVVTW